MSEILSSLPPEAEIVSGPGSEVTVAIPASLADTTEYNLASESIEPKNEFQIKDSGPLSSSAPMAKIDSSRPTRKPKKSEPNVILEFAKIVVGGAAGLLIAVMMIMWFGHQDVFKIVPKLPPQAYFLVPEELRTAEMRELANEGKTPDQLNSNADVPVESIPTEDPMDDEPAEQSLNTDNQVSRNKPADDVEESPLAAAFQQQVNASKQTTPQKKTAAQPKSKPTGRKVNAEMPVNEPIVSEEPTTKPMQPANESNAAEASTEEVSAEPTQPTPIDPMLVEMITEASKELGPIGAEIPPPEQPGEAEPISEGNVDLAPVDDGDK
ncbi:hypothetical protein [Bremerella volcania]|nr:hypothetical protein [Bremerella volcania]